MKFASGGFQGSKYPRDSLVDPESGDQTGLLPFSTYLNMLRQINPYRRCWYASSRSTAFTALVTEK